jgi:hypothetical protein
VIRIAPTPIYGRFVDCFMFAQTVQAWDRIG